MLGTSSKKIVRPGGAVRGKESSASYPSLQDFFLGGPSVVVWSVASLLLHSSCSEPTRYRTSPNVEHSSWCQGAAGKRWSRLAPQLRLATSSSDTELVDGVPLVALTPTGLFLDGQELLSLENGRLQQRDTSSEGAARPRLVEPLLAALSKRSAEPLPTGRRVSIAIDAEADFETASAVISSAQSAGRQEIQLVVRGADSALAALHYCQSTCCRESPSPCWGAPWRPPGLPPPSGDAATNAGHATLAEALEAEPPASPPRPPSSSLRIVVGDDGYTVQTGLRRFIRPCDRSIPIGDGAAPVSTTIPTKASTAADSSSRELDPAALRSCLTRIKRRHPELYLAVIGVEGPRSWQEVVTSLDAVRGSRGQPLLPRFFLFF